MDSLGQELRRVEVALRDEIRGVDAALRSEIRDLDVALRGEIRDLDVALRGEIRTAEARLRDEIRNGEVMTVTTLTEQIEESRSQTRLLFEELQSRLALTQEDRAKNRRKKSGEA